MRWGDSSWGVDGGGVCDGVTAVGVGDGGGVCGGVTAVGVGDGGGVCDAVTAGGGEAEQMNEVHS